MRILHAIGEMGAGGAESLVAEMVRRGAERGWTSGVASSGGLRAEQLLAEGLCVHFDVPLAKRRATGVLSATRALRSAITDFEPEVIIGHNVGATMMASMATRSRRVAPPVVGIFHGVAAEDYGKAATILSRFPDVVVTVSQAIRERLDLAGFTGDSLMVIPNAVTPPVLPAKDEARASLGLPDLPIGLCLARMVPQKRHDVLIDAWSRLTQPALLLLAGDGPDRAALEAQVRALGLEEQIQFLGVRSDVPVLLAASDITCLSSDWEGLPIAVLESLAAGRPIVATAVDGVADAVGTEAGRLVPPRDPAALASGLQELLHDPDARERAELAARERVRTTFSPTTMMNSYQAAIDTALRASSERGLTWRVPR